MTRTIANPLPCIRCRCELQGLPEDAVCPECALPVQDSIDGRIHDERFAVIRAAVRTLAWTISVKSPFTCAGGLTVIVAAFFIGFVAAAPLGYTLPLLIALTAVAAAVVILEWIALFRLTSQAGVRGMAVGRHSEIGFLHAGMLAQIIFGASAALAAIGPEPWIAGIIALGVVVGRFVQFVATCVVFGRLARRLGAEGVAKWCFAMTWTIPAVAILGTYAFGLGGVIAAGLNIATAVRMNNAVGREDRRRRHLAARRAAVTATPAPSPDVYAWQSPTHDSSAPSPDPTRENPST